MGGTTGKICQFKISLREVRPVVWRRIQVPERYSFWDLHVAIQDAMGWTDSHLHEFHINDPRTSTSVRIGIPDEDAFEDDEPVFAGWELRIADCFSSGQPSARYSYDFGDGWQHTVTLEAVLPKSAASSTGDDSRAWAHPPWVRAAQRHRSSIRL